MKRGRDESDEPEIIQNGESRANAVSEHPRKIQAADEEDSDLDEPVQPLRRASQVRKGHECPYLDTVSRQVTCTTQLSFASETGFAGALECLDVCEKY